MRERSSCERGVEKGATCSEERGATGGESSALAGFRIQPRCLGQSSRPLDRLTHRRCGPLAGRAECDPPKQGLNPLDAVLPGVALRPLDQRPRNSVLMLKHGEPLVAKRVGSASGASRARRRCPLSAVRCRCLLLLLLCSRSASAPAPAAHSTSSRHVLLTHIVLSSRARLLLFGPSLCAPDARAPTSLADGLGLRHPVRAATASNLHSCVEYARYASI